MGFAVVDADTFSLRVLVGSTGCVLYVEINSGWLLGEDDGNEDVKFEVADTFADTVDDMDGDGLRNLTVADEQTKINKGVRLTLN